MKIRVVSVGKPKDPRWSAIHDDYAKRIARIGVAYDTKWVREVKADGAFSDDHVREREAVSLAEALEPKSTVVTLDTSGELLDSEGLASRLERWAARHASFVIGGPLGLHRSLVGRADARWALSPLTFPHEMVRAVLAEQLYRALTILRGIPYHK
ncbi:MAG: 23S rRNA (pseudouridine(1915)-N(3))-methyltransferase RlmH [Acidobacteriota bacterium]|nr:23S rRNA (pseudouridine(1915)-N(3))-methyltransferase RlmH [Acidobacteriota bacterium]